MELGKAQKHMVSTVAVPSSSAPAPAASSGRSSRSSMLIAPPPAITMQSVASLPAAPIVTYGAMHYAQQDMSTDHIMPPPVAPSAKERGVRFQLDPSPVHASQPLSEENCSAASMRPFSGPSSNAEEGQGRSANKPLAVQSFLSSSQPERGVPRVRSLGSSRRQSVVPPPSALLASVPSQPYSVLLGNTKTRSMLLSGGAQPFATHSTDVKENDNMNSASSLAFSVAAVSNKRDSSYFDNFSMMPAKRAKAVDGGSSSSSTLGLGGAAYRVAADSNGFGAGGGNNNSRKSTWR